MNDSDRAPSVLLRSIVLNKALKSKILPEPSAIKAAFGFMFFNQSIRTLFKMANAVALACLPKKSKKITRSHSRSPFEKRTQSLLRSLQKSGALFSTLFHLHWNLSKDNLDYYKCKNKYKVFNIYWKVQKTIKSVRKIWKLKKNKKALKSSAFMRSGSTIFANGVHHALFFSRA